MSNRFGNDATRTVPIENIALPNLSLPMQLAYNEQFSLFVPQHRKMAGNLIDVFLGEILLRTLALDCALLTVVWNTPYKSDQMFDAIRMEMYISVFYPMSFENVFYHEYL